jgi:uncharacterized alpha-E superfamily protein
MLLSSTAENLFWMARYVERAENVARILDVAFRMGLLPSAEAEAARAWAAPLEIAGDPAGFAKRYRKAEAENVIAHLALDEEHPSSIRSAIRRARENARAVRGVLTSESWESLNATWLALEPIKSVRDIEKRGFREFFDWVKERSHLFRGVTDGTMIQDESYAFVRLGVFLERADNTARLLGVKYRETRPKRGAEDDRAYNYYEWGAILRSVSAFKTYRRIYRDEITPRRVAELLVLRQDMPRSLHACFNRIAEILEEIGRGKECARMAGAIHAGLHYETIDALLKRGLDDYLRDFVRRSGDLGRQIAEDFLMVPSVGKP